MNPELIQATANVTTIALTGAVISVLVGFISQRVLSRQRQLAELRQSTAGILEVDQVEETIPFTSFAQVLEENQPVTKLCILATSGVSLLSRGPEVLDGLLHKGVDVDILLLDPSPDKTWLFKEHEGLQLTTASNLALLKKVAQLSQQRSGHLSIRLYSQPVLENLMFIDNDRLFISSYLPIYSPNRLVYEVRKGEHSLFNLYEPAFEFLWKHAYHPSQ